eukprot:TRINITY_DN7024_c0_g2_i1.p1 TRINITY_DN7024_c0_g2~~TRINITY_DN7024_c0_g2_i1.p1  ORF type:complete len:446 (-),score=107.75 TRINITY_DN7024_c0_g2_i1:67-1236(-)
MAWHDVHVKLRGAPARDVAINFIERWNFSKLSLERITVPIQTPKTTPLKPHLGTQSVQVLRSLGNWHLANYTKGSEKSIYEAYLHYISTAEKFIYIENQYFISSLAGNEVKNEIAKAILERIKKAIEENAKFKIIIILPVHPEGTFKDDAGIRYVMNWQYKTINRCKTALLTQLTLMYPNLKNLDEYISFNALRKAQYLATAQTFVTEQIYVHTKLMIVDDRVVIVGSANINDRSMEGERDSEIAVVIEDSNVIQSTMGGDPFVVAEFAHNLRKKLWREHLGIQESPYQLVDLVSDPLASWNYWLDTAKKNTEILQQMFQKLPSDDVSAVSEITTVTPAIKGNPNDAGMDLNRVCGHLIQFPLNFLRAQSLEPNADEMEIKLADIDIFT